MSEGHGDVDELSYEPRPVPSHLIRFVVVAAVIALLVVATLAAWMFVRSASPTLSQDQVSSLYQPPPAANGSWEEPQPMTARSVQDADLISQLSPASCQESAAPLFDYLTPGSLDGTRAIFGGEPDEDFGSASTQRYRDEASAKAEFERATTALSGCRLLTLPVQYGSVELSLEPGQHTSSWRSGQRISYLLTTHAEGDSQLATLVGLQFGNTISWQQQNKADGSRPSPKDAQPMMNALQSRIRQIARTR